MSTHTPARHLLTALASIFLVLATLVLALAPAPAPANAASQPGPYLEVSLKTIYAKALTDHECNNDEWHFVITKVKSASNAPASIHVTWANGNEEDVPLSGVTGKTAHYSVYSNLDSTVIEATAQIYPEWNGEFNLSHGPCAAATATPTPPPTETSTPTPTATTIPLVLTSICYRVENDVKIGTMRLRNPNPVNVPFTWHVYGGGGSGAGTAPAKPDDQPYSEIFFDVPHPGTIVVQWSGGSTVKAQNNVLCATPTPTETSTPPPTATQTAQPLPAFCQQIGASKRAAKPGEMVSFEGRAQSGTQGYAITAYKFIFGDGSQTAWVSVSPPAGPFTAFASHAYTNPGRYQVEFLVRLANGQVVGGARTRCALVMTIIPPPPPQPICVERPPLFITGVVEQGRQLALSGLSWDGAQIEIQIQGPSDPDFVANGLTTADAYGHWAYTTTALGENGVYRIRAVSYGQPSENTVVYTMDGSGPALRISSFRSGVANYRATNDTYINEQVPYLSHWGQFTVSLRTEDVMAPMVWFDLRSIPHNAHIVMAKLGLYSLDAEPCTNMVASSYQLLRSWDQTATTWISATQQIPWGIPGANNSLIDRLSEPTYTETVRAPYTWYTWDVTDMVQQWVANPSSNFGLIVKAWTYGREVLHADNDLDDPHVILEMEPLVSGVGGRRDFAASEYAEVRRRPVLYVTYIIP